MKRLDETISIISRYSRNTIYQIMPQSLNRVFIHVVWSTKFRQPFIKSSVENKIHNSIRNELISCGCYVISINGTEDHVHCLFIVNVQNSIAEIMKRVKGATSYYVNENNLISEKFIWQKGYAAFSVSESAVTIVKSYIENQKDHHQILTLEKEIPELLND